MGVYGGGVRWGCTVGVYGGGNRWVMTGGSDRWE